MWPLLQTAWIWKVAADAADATRGCSSWCCSSNNWAELSHINEKYSKSSQISTGSIIPYH